MKKCLVLLLCGALMMTGCSREMLSHTTEKEMEKMVGKAVKESFELYEVIDEVEDEDKITYVYYLPDRDVYFRAVSDIDEILIDGSSFGFHHNEDIYYEVDIVSDEKNLSLREEIAKEYGVWDEVYTYDNEARFYTCIENYEQLSDMAYFLIEMDNIYDFDEDDIDYISRVENNLGLLVGDDKDKTFTTIEYAPYGDRKLSYEQLYPYLEEQYVLMVKQYGIIDSTIPDDVYEKYTEEDE